MTRSEAIQWNKELKQSNSDIVAKHGEKAFKEIQKNPDQLEKILIEIFYESAEDVVKNVLTKINKSYPININPANYKFFDADGKTPEDRIHRWVNEIKENPTLLFAKFMLILDTEKNNITYQVIKNKINSNEVMVEIIGELDECNGGCDKYNDGKPHKLDEVEYPPYHPDCECEAIFYIPDEVV